MSQYLDADAMIIAESPTHAVVTLRIPKSWIANNLALLAALADMVPARSAAPHLHDGQPPRSRPGCNNT